MTAASIAKELRAQAQQVANCDDMGGVWCYTHWAEKSNDSGVLAAVKYDSDDIPSRGQIDNDPDLFYSQVIAACEDDLSGGIRARYIAAACPANIATLIEAFEAMGEALTEAEKLHKIGLLNAPDDLYDRVRDLRKAALAKAGL